MGGKVLVVAVGRVVVPDLAPPKHLLPRPQLAASHKMHKPHYEKAKHVKIRTLLTTIWLGHIYSAQTMMNQSDTFVCRHEL